MVSAIMHMSGIFLVLHALKEWRGKRAYTVVLWKGVLKLWRKPELTPGGEEVNHGELLKQDLLLLRL